MGHVTVVFMYVVGASSLVSELGAAAHVALDMAGRAALDLMMQRWVGGWD